MIIPQIPRLVNCQSRFALTIAPYRRYRTYFAEMIAEGIAEGSLQKVDPEQILEGLGVDMLPKEAFGPTPFPTDWLDTTESEALLHFQQRDLSDYVQDMRRLLGVKRFFIWLFRPLVRRWLLTESPHWREARSRRVSVHTQELHTTGAV